MQGKVSLGTMPSPAGRALMIGDSVKSASATRVDLACRLARGEGPRLRRANDGVGHIRMRSCEDRGPDDNCGDLHVQLAWGQTRYIVSGGLSAAIERIRLAAPVGVQRLVAPGESARLWFGVSIAPPQ